MAIAKPRHVAHRVFRRLRQNRSSIRTFLTAQSTALDATGDATTFTADAIANTFAATAHGFSPGEGPVEVANAGGALPEGLLADTLYWIGVVSVNTFTLHINRRQAVLGTGAVDITTTGTGTQTIFRATTSPAMLEWLRNGNKPERIDAATNIDELA